MCLSTVVAQLRAALKPVTMMARGKRFGIARYVIVLLLCELTVFVVVSVNSPGIADHAAARVNGAPPTLISAPSLKNTPSRSIPILGSTAAAFTREYGQPIGRNATQQGRAVLRFQDEGALNQLTVVVAPPTETVVMISLQAEDGDPWNAQTAEMVCRQFAPGDATEIAPIVGPIANGDEMMALYSRFLASDIRTYLPAGASAGKAGRFTVTLIKMAPGVFSGCMLSL